MRDQSFIQDCLVRLEYAFFKYQFRFDDKITEEDLERLNESHSIFKYITTINEAPNRSRNKKIISYTDKTVIYINKIETTKVEQARFRQVNETIICCEKGEWTFGKPKTKMVTKYILHRPEAQEFIDLLLKQQDDLKKSIQNADIN